MKRITSLIAFFALFAPITDSQAADRPNVIVVMTDEMERIIIDLDQINREKQSISGCLA